MPPEIIQAARALLTLCQKQKLTIATAESCSGGLVAAALTSIAGSSQIFLAGLVTYSNRAKMKILGIDRELLKKYGAVSEECALAMAKHAHIKTDASLTMSITGIAGPSGGTKEKPVGFVHIAGYYSPQNAKPVSKAISCQFGDRSREDIRHCAVLEALKLALELADRNGDALDQ